MNPVGALRASGIDLDDLSEGVWHRVRLHMDYQGGRVWISTYVKKPRTNPPPSSSTPREDEDDG